MLESELSVAGQSLTVDEEGFYIPAEDPEKAEVQAGEIYLHGSSGERKATGTYYTKDIFVEHLLDYSLEPALDKHLERLRSLSDRDAEDAFFDFRAADIAMGSGHFLVGAVDRIESRLSSYLAERPLLGIQRELDRLANAASQASDPAETPEIERSQLLRRQIARRCIYGVDLNAMATELARLSLWIHTFVPGLPLTFLDYNLVTGDSLSGIGTLREAEKILGADRQRLDWYSDPDSGVINRIQQDIARLGRLAASLTIAAVQVFLCMSSPQHLPGLGSREPFSSSTLFSFLSSVSSRPVQHIFGVYLFTSPSMGGLTLRLVGEVAQGSVQLQ